MADRPTNASSPRARGGFRSSTRPEPALSVIIPARDEEGALAAVAAGVLAHMPASAELILVDDGSRDGTLEVLRTLVARDPRVRGFSLASRLGKAQALALATASSRGAILITLDGDGQDDPAALPVLLAHLQEWDLDLVCGWRRARRDALRKRLPSLCVNAFLHLVLGLPLHDVNCGLKAYRRTVALALPLVADRHRYFPLMAWLAGYRVGEREVPHHPRRYGRSKYGPLRVYRSIVDLVAILAGYLGRRGSGRECPRGRKAVQTHRSAAADNGKPEPNSNT